MAEQSDRRRWAGADEWFRRREQRREQADPDSTPRLDYQRPVILAPVRGRRSGRPPASARPRPPAADQDGLLEAILGGEGNTAR